MQWICRIRFQHSAGPLLAKARTGKREGELLCANSIIFMEKAGKNDYCLKIHIGGTIVKRIMSRIFVIFLSIVIRTVLQSFEE